MGVSQFYWFFTWVYWVLLGFTGFYRVLLCFTWFYLVLLGFTWFYLVLLGFTWFYLVLLAFIGFNWFFHGYAKCYRVGSGPRGVEGQRVWVSYGNSRRLSAFSDSIFEWIAAFSSGR